MTAMYLGLSLFPIIDVPRLLLSTAVGGFVLGCQLTAAPFFNAYQQRSRNYASVRSYARSCPG